jgi:hypothetical protein
MDNQQERLSDFDLGWLIGIIDGEGSFWLARSPSGYLPVFEIVNTNFDIIAQIELCLKKLGISYHIYIPTRNSRQKPYKKLEVKGIERLKKFFDKLAKYFKCRFDQADLLRQFVEHRLSVPKLEPYTEVENQIFYLLKHFNHRGSQ